MQDVSQSRVMGTPMPRVDGPDKVTGRTAYTADIPLQGLLWGKALRSTHAHARIVRVDVTRAQALPGVHAILTGDDLSGVRFGRRVIDVPVLADGVVRFIGEQVAAVAAVDEETAERALALIEVTYDPLPAVFDAAEAMLAGAVVVHPDLAGYEGVTPPPGAPPNVFDVHTWGQGDPAIGFGQAQVVVENTFTVPVVHQAYLESHACQAYVDGDGRFQVWANNKTPYNAKWQLAAALGVEPGQVRVHPVAIGGDFGGKGSPMDMALCCYLAREAGRPVRMAFDYGEEFLAANPRHSARIHMRTGALLDGTLTAQEVDVVFNSGAYGGFKPRSFLVGAAAAGGPYRIPHTRITAHQVYTNRVPCGHMRGPGEAQTMFALESQLDLLAREIGMDPAQLRRRNVVREGDATAIGHRYAEIRAEETLDAALEAVGRAQRPSVPAGWRYGRGVAFADRPPGGGESNTAVAFHGDGTVVVSTPVFEQGSGTYTLLKQVVMETLGISGDRVRIKVVDTDEVAWDSGVGANRVARIATRSAHEAAGEARGMLFGLAEEHLGWERPNIELRDGALVRADTGETHDWAALVARSETPVAGRADVDESSAPEVTSFTAQVAEVAVDPETGQVRLLRLTTAHDVGRIIDPIGHQGQINGGALMGIGYGLLEELPIDGGRVTALSFADVKIPTIADIPELVTVLLEADSGVGPFRIKSIGEASNTPPAPAIVNAIADATGVRITDLPATAEKVYAAMRAAASDAPTA
jgi:carbon-monoxide dehydrogenase large subunit